MRENGLLDPGERVVEDAEPVEQYREALEEAFTFRVTWDGEEETPTFDGLAA